MPRDPQRSDVEVFLDPGFSSVLTEDAEQTLYGLLESSQSLVETMGSKLLDFWNWRKAHLQLLPQPAAQWPKGVSTDSVGFGGYAPGAYAVDPTLFTTNPAVVNRLRAAALDDASRANWANFD